MKPKELSDRIMESRRAFAQTYGNGVLASPLTEAWEISTEGRRLIRLFQIAENKLRRTGLLEDGKFDDMTKRAVSSYQPVLITAMIRG